MDVLRKHPEHQRMLGYAGWMQGRTDNSDDFVAVCEENIDREGTEFLDATTPKLWRIAIWVDDLINRMSGSQMNVEYRAWDVRSSSAYPKGPSRT